MAVFKYFLLLLCAGELVYGDLCTTMQFGRIIGSGHPTGQAILSRDQQEFVLPIDNLCPSNNTVVGVEITACDYDVAPTVMITILNQARIIRNGMYEEEGTVEYTVYCI